LDPPGLRRLRFPFFDLLVKEHWGKYRKRPARLGAARSLRRRSRSPGFPGKPRVQSGDCLPTAAHQYVAREHW